MTGYTDCTGVPFASVSSPLSPRRSKRLLNVSAPRRRPWGPSSPRGRVERRREAVQGRDGRLRPRHFVGRPLRPAQPSPVAAKRGAAVAAHHHHTSSSRCGLRGVGNHVSDMDWSTGTFLWPSVLCRQSTALLVTAAASVAVLSLLHSSPQAPYLPSVARSNPGGVGDAAAQYKVSRSSAMISLRHLSQHYRRSVLSTGFRQKQTPSLAPRAAGVASVKWWGTMLVQPHVRNLPSRVRSRRS